jgi:hypothetical protein
VTSGAASRLGSLELFSNFLLQELFKSSLELPDKAYSAYFRYALANLVPPEILHDAIICD